MTWGSSTKLQNVNIVSNNYSRYGTSVYNKLYSDSYSKNNLNSPKNSYNNNTKNNVVNGHRERKVATTVVTKEIISGSQKNTTITNDNDTTSVKKSKSKSKIRSKYKSLITSSSRKLKSKLRDTSSDSFSIFSSKSRHSRKHSISSKKSYKVELFPISFPEKLADINELPSELLVHIMEIDNCIEINDILAISLVSKKFNHAAKKTLYKAPDFNSTYRVAQFVTSLRLHPENGKLVKSLDLSHLKNGIIPKPSTSEDEANNKDANTSLPMIGPDFFDDNVAFAGWRDWRHRNDSPMVLNSYNMKRALSRTSSISSMNSLNTNSIMTNSPLTNDSRSRGRTRSSSSVSSITSSIMSTFQNGNNVGNGSYSSSVSTHSNLSSRSSSRHRSGSIVMMNSRQRTNSLVSMKNINTGKDTNKTKIPQQQQKSNNSNTSTNSISKWYNMKLRSKNRRNTVTNTIKKEKSLPVTTETKSQSSITSSPNSATINPDTSITSSILSEEKERSPSPLLSSQPGLGNSTDQPTTPQNNLSLSFILEKPIRQRHPYTSRSLLKYAPYRDLPLGHILHILEHCPNLENINLSNIVLFNDFKVINRTSTRKISSLVLPAVRESEISSSAENSLDIVYMTDSSKNIENYDQINEDGDVIEVRRNSGVAINNSWLNSSTSKPIDYPKPIDSHTKTREDLRRQSKNRDQLLKLNPSIIFETLLDINRNGSLKFLQMDSSIWCRQYMVKYFILNSFNQKDQCSDYEDKSLSLSFLKSGMNRNFPWSCKGNLHDVTTIIVLDELLKMDDFQLEELYRIKTEKYYESMLKTHDPSIIETSNIFPISYGETEEGNNRIKFRLTVIKSNKPTSYKLSRVTKQNVSLCVRLCINENINRTTSPNEQLPKDPLQRIDRLTHALMAKVQELRSTELRRNIGENNYYRND